MATHERKLPTLPGFAGVAGVDHALSSLSERDIVELDEERKAAMVSNLMVVLVSDRGAQPVVNSGSLYT
jgi:hypothetical protein